MIISLLSSNMMKSNNCYICYSDKHIIYTYNKFVCKKCKIILEKCDICGLYCGNTCIDMFNKILTF